MIDDVSMAGFILAVFVFGITVGKFVEKIKRFIIGKEDEMFCLESFSSISVCLIFYCSLYIT